MRIMTVLKTFGVAVAAALVAGTAAAQTEAGKWDVSFMGGFSYSWANALEDSDFETSLALYSGTVSFGYFISDAWEVKGNVSVFGFNGAIGDEGVNGQPNDVSGLVVPLTTGVDYHFNTKSKYVPYVGAALGAWVVGAAYGEDWLPAGGFVGDLHAGLKQFVSKDVAIDYRLGYQMVVLPGTTVSNVAAFIGLSFFF